MNCAAKKDFFLRFSSLCIRTYIYYLGIVRSNENIMLILHVQEGFLLNKYYRKCNLGQLTEPDSFFCSNYIKLHISTYIQTFCSTQVSLFSGLENLSLPILFGF